MERKDLLQYEGSSVKLRYTNKNDHRCTQTGIIYAVTIGKVVFWPFEHEVEIDIPLKNVKGVHQL